MRRLFKTVIIVAVMLVAAGLLTGCGEASAKRKIGKEARYYVANKYKFRPNTTDVELQKVGELEGVWHKKEGGTATTEYQDRTFKVYVSLVDPEIRYDNYLQQDAEEYLIDFFTKGLVCDDIHVWATYGVPVCMVPGDVKTVEEIFEKCDNIQVYVSTIGLDRDSAKNLNVTELGSHTQIHVIDWAKEDCLNDEELMRETVVGLESDSYTDGFGKFKSYYNYSEGNVTSVEK